MINLNSINLSDINLGGIDLSEIKLGMTYLKINRCVFILDTDGNLVKRTDWNTSNNNKAAGVAVLSDNCRFVISPDESPSRLAWGGYGTAISGIVTVNDLDAAKQDYAGSGNTDKIIAQLGPGNAPAADYCRGVTFKHGKKGYLGSLGEWLEAWKNKAEVDACMSLIGETAINTSSFHWTSNQSEPADRYSMLICFGDDENELYSDHKMYTYFVRAFAAL